MKARRRKERAETEGRNVSPLANLSRSGDSRQGASWS